MNYKNASFSLKQLNLGARGRTRSKTEIQNRPLFFS